MTYDVDYFIAKFEAIPEEKWCIERYWDDAGRRCAYGHLQDGTPSAAGQALAGLFQKYLHLLGGSINDGRCKEYPQPTPKQRILAALRDIKSQSLTPSNSQ